MKESNLNQKEIKDKLIHIAFTPQEKTEIKNYADENNTSISEFIRLAVREKIMRIENPEMFQEKVLSNIDNKLMKEILAISMENKSKINKMLKVIGDYNQIKDTLAGLSSLIERPGLKEKELVIVNLLKEHGSLKIEKIMELTNYSKEEIYEVISNDKVFSIDLGNGGIKLNE